MTTLEELGYGPFFAAQRELLDPAGLLEPARVVSDGRGTYELAGPAAPEGRPWWGEVSGRLRHELRPRERPATGDWVLVSTEEERAVVHHVLDRRTVLERRAAGTEASAQIIAANVDVFFVVTSANRDLNPRRLERYLVAVAKSGASAVIVLNKADLVEDPAPMVSAIEAVALAAEVVVVSAREAKGLSGLWNHVHAGRTVGFIGSSGVGKSTLVNRLLADDRQETQSPRADEKGRHTTTRRQLVLLGGGGVLVDTPGMRELGLLDAAEAIDDAFAEVARLGAACRFRDCEHRDEPGCAVRSAVSSGALSAQRLESYLRLRREVASAAARRDPILAANTKRRWKSIHKEVRASTKRRDRGL